MGNKLIKPMLRLLEKKSQIETEYLDGGLKEKKDLVFSLIKQPESMMHHDFLRIIRTFEPCKYEFVAITNEDNLKLLIKEASTEVSCLILFDSDNSNEQKGLYSIVLHRVDDIPNYRFY